MKKMEKTQSPKAWSLSMINRALLLPGLLTFSSLWSTVALSDDAPFMDGVGAVDLKFLGKCASDLYYGNRVLLPTEACQLALDGEAKFKQSKLDKKGQKFKIDGQEIYAGDPSVRFDLSTLEPDPTTAVINANDPKAWMWRPPQDASADIIAYRNVEEAAKKDPNYGYYNDLKGMNLKETGETLEFVSSTEVSLGRHAIIVKKPATPGSTDYKYYELRFDVKGHNFLLRKTLLRKIGYQVPFMDRLAQVKVKFSNSYDLVNFVQTLNTNTLMDASRWVTDANVDLLSIKNADEKKQAEIDEKTKDIQSSLELNMIDLIAIDGMNDRSLNLGRGRLSSDVIQGKRALNSLLLPFSLVDVPESINIFDNSMCDVFNNQLYLSYEFGLNPDGESIAFKPSYEDARWIARKILSLNRNDWIQIVNSGRLPDEVSMILLEKLISRRNCLRTTLNLAQEKADPLKNPDALKENTVELPVNLSISSGQVLKDGKLTAPAKLLKSDGVKKDENQDLEKWPGYARHFSGNDADSPQSKSELLSYAKSQVVFNLIRNVVFKFNQNLPKTNLEEKEFDRDLDLAVWQFGEFIKTKSVPNIPRNIWSQKYYNVFAFPDRDIIAGNYMGSDNQVQVADSLTLGLDLGYAYRGEGMPVRMGLRGQAKINYVKSWVHLKPLASMKLGLKEPFKNIIVPYFESRANRPLQALLNLETEYDKLNRSLEIEKDEAKIEEIQKQKQLWAEKFKAKVAEFNKLFGPNESVIVSSSIGPDISATLVKGVSDVAALVAQARARFVDLSRLNIVRKGKDKIQIYFDPTLYSDLRLSLGLQAHTVPLVQFDWSLKNGMTTTNFFEYNIDSTLLNNDSPGLKNKDFFNGIRFLSAALKGTSMSFFEKQQKPTVIEHKFKDFNFGLKTVNVAELLKFRLANWRYESESSNDSIKITTPDGREANYLRVTEGSRKGTDYLNLLVNVTGVLLKKRYPDLQINIQDNGDSSNSPAGRAISRHAIVEAEVTPHGLNLSNLLANVRYVWKGWSKSARAAEKTFDEMEHMFGVQIFKRPDLGTTKEIQFYNLAVNVSLYREAIQNIMIKTDQEVDAIFKEFGTTPVMNSGELYQADQPDAWATYMKNKIRSFNKNIKNDPKEAAEAFTDIMSVLQSKMTFAGMMKMCGGIQNIFIQGNFAGFRTGDQRIGNPTSTPTLTAPTYGQIGNYEPAGPLSTILGKTGIANGELFITWLLSPL